MAEESDRLITGAQSEVHEVQTSGFRQRVKDYCNCALSDRLLAIIIALILFSISLALTVSYYQTASYQPERFPHYIVLVAIMVFEAVAAFCLLVMFGASTQPADDGVTDADLKKWQQRIRRNIKLFGIVPFVFAIATFDFLRLLARWNCDDASNACSNWVIRWDHLVDQGYPHHTYRLPFH